MTTAHKKIATLVALTFALSAIPDYFMISTGKLEQGPVLGLMWCPGISAIITQLAFQRSLRGMGWKLGKPSFLLLGYFVPVAYGLVAYAVLWLTGLGRLDATNLLTMIAAQTGAQVSSPVVLMAIYLGIIVTLGTVQSMFSAAGEEIGWRGLLVPELSNVTSFTRTALISGGVWAVWHYPLLLFADYHNQGAPAWFGLICFTILAVSASFIAAWLRLRSGSLWPAVLLHASHNLYIQNVFTPLTQNTGLTPYFVDEFGVMLALAAAIAAYIVWRKRGEIEPAAASEEPSGAASGAPSGAA
jgi:membrane protease YdiL (CAAX protease family)